jgi:hypothetical protein
VDDSSESRKIPTIPLLRVIPASATPVTLARGHGVSAHVFLEDQRCEGLELPIDCLARWRFVYWTLPSNRKGEIMRSKKVLAFSRMIAVLWVAMLAGSRSVQAGLVTYTSAVRSIPSRTLQLTITYQLISKTASARSLARSASTTRRPERSTEPTPSIAASRST